MQRGLTALPPLTIILVTEEEAGPAAGGSDLDGVTEWQSQGLAPVIPLHPKQALPPVWVRTGSPAVGPPPPPQPPLLGGPCAGSGRQAG